MLEDKYTPDVICNSINWCKSTNGQVCRLFPAPQTKKGTRMNPEEFAQHIKETSEKFDFSHVGNVNSCDYIP
jgi:hypothetical protein